MAKVIVEYKGRKTEFEGNYVLGIAINSIDKDPMEAEGLQCGNVNVGDLAVALGRTVGTLVDNLADNEPEKQALIWDEFIKALMGSKKIESEENNDVDESNI